MNEVTHMLGLCPDAFSHIDVLDLLTSNQTVLIQILNWFNKK
jgi:hypothetical protein